VQLKPAFSFPAGRQAPSFLFAFFGFSLPPLSAQGLPEAPDCVAHIGFFYVSSRLRRNTFSFFSWWILEECSFSICRLLPFSARDIDDF